MNKHRGRSFPGRQQELLAVLPNLRRFALSLCANMADADDLLQTTVERVLLRGLPEDAEVLPWTMKVLRNLWIDEIRARKVRQAAARDPLLSDEQVLEGEADAVGKLALREMQQALQDIPEEQRSVLELVAVEGYSYKEAAEFLAIPIGTIMSRLARARAALADRLEHDR
jgi:RNA polymerase sigma-70 factor (ECF subfamily)